MLETYNLDKHILMSHTFCLKQEVLYFFSQLYEILKKSVEVCVLEWGRQVGLSCLK